jgi:hypothetical protein
MTEFTKKNEGYRGYWGRLSHCTALAILEKNGIELDGVNIPITKGTYLISYRHKKDNGDRDYYIYCRGRLPIRIARRSNKLNISNLYWLAKKVGEHTNLFELIEAVKKTSGSPLTIPLPHVPGEAKLLKDYCDAYEERFAKKRATGVAFQDTIEKRISEAVVGSTAVIGGGISGAVFPVLPFSVPIGTIIGYAVGTVAGTATKRGIDKMRGSRNRNATEVALMRPER